MNEMISPRENGGGLGAGIPFKRDSETQETYRLKWAAWEWLYTAAQCRCIGMEVRLEGPSGRVVDLAAVGPGNQVFVIEVKSSRSDFSRDNHTPEDLDLLRARGRVVAARTKLARDTLAQAADYARREHAEEWREVFTYRQALADYRRVIQKERAYRSHLATYSIKFHDTRFMGIADYHYLIAPRSTVPRCWLPPQWGLLDGTPKIVVPAVKKAVRKDVGIISNVLRAIARSNTRAMMKSQGVTWTEEGPEFQSSTLFAEDRKP